jgi:hypothetical protein
MVRILQCEIGEPSSLADAPQVRRFYREIVHFGHYAELTAALEIASVAGITSAKRSPGALSGHANSSLVYAIHHVLRRVRSPICRA